jgi:hypothetical protein
VGERVTDATTPANFEHVIGAGISNVKEAWTNLAEEDTRRTQDEWKMRNGDISKI